MSTTTATAPAAQVWPLAPLQEGLLFHALGDDSVLDVYSMQSTYRFAPAPSSAVLGEACATLLERHDVLRAGFTTAVADHPVQFIPGEVTLPLVIEDLSEHSRDDAEAALERIQRREREARFVMDRPPLVRFVDVRLPTVDGRSQAALVVTNHHILYDGWSDALLVTELLSHIAAGGCDTAQKEPPSFGDYLGWLSSRDEDAALKTWTRALDGVSAGSIVAEGRAGDTVLPGVVELDLGEELTAGVELLARTCAVSLSTVYSTVWGLVLRALTGRDDVVFGTTVSGRPADLAGVERMVGLFLNTVPQRVTINPHVGVVSLLSAGHRAQAAVIDAHHVGLGPIQRAVGVGPLFDTLYVMRNTPQDDSALDALAAGAGLVELDGGDATHYPLTFIVHPGQNTRLILSYREDLYSQEEAEQTLRGARDLLRAMSEGPDTPVGALIAWPEDVTARWLDKGRSPAVDGVGADSLLALLEQSVRAYPDRPSLIGSDAVLSYAHLWNGIVSVARALSERGVGPGDLVGIDMPRGAGTVVAILGVLARGAAYAPVDQAHPAAHRVQLLDSAGVACVLTGGEAARGEAPQIAVPDLAIAGELCTVSAEELHPRYRHTDLACLIHTSGSTGAPKGVQITHAGLVNMLHNHRRRIFEPAGADPQHPFTIAHTVSFAFDMSWEELLWLVDGHTVLVLDEETRHDPGIMVRTLEDARVDVVNVTPSLGEALVEAGLMDGRRPRLVLLGGEPVTVRLWETLRHTPGVLGYNLYGPTEYTINTLGAATTDSPSPVVGVPIDNTNVYVLDSSLHPVADGVPGELWVSGIGLAHGYRGLPALTAERFVACPFAAPGSRMYRTGDIVARRPDGQFDFLGRGDEQVKIRGHRVEPAHVQAVLARSPHVSACAVLACKNPVGAQVLVAYVVLASAADTSALLAADAVSDALRTEVRAQLPEHFVPTAIVVLGSLPLTVNSKLDIRALPEPDFARTAHVRPRTALEVQICEAFEVALGTTDVGAEDDLFALGGHSLTAMRAATLLSTRTGRRVSVAAVMAAPTPRSLAQRIDAATDPRAVLLPLGHSAATNRPVPGGSHLDAVVFVHGAWGIGWSFSTLAARQNDRVPSWALQSPGLSGWPLGVPKTLDELVDQLADAVHAGLVGSSGTTPLLIRLVGWSFGAHLAGHLERALAERGIVVAEAVLLDPGLPSTASVDDPARSYDPAQVEQEALDFLVRSAGAEAPVWLTPPYIRADVLAHLAESAGVFSHFTGDELDALVDCYAVNAGLLGTLPARVPLANTVLVSALLDAPIEQVVAAEQSWQRLASSAGTTLRTLRMNIDHESFTTASSAEQLMRLLSEPHP